MTQVAVLPLPARPATPAEHKARAAAEQYEEMFLSQMLEHMTAGLKVDETFGGGPAEGMFRSMLNEQYARSIVRNGGIGVADVVYREMLRLQEIAQ